MIHDVAARAGVMLRTRAVAMYGTGVVRARLDAGKWQAPVARVVVLHNGPLTSEQRTWVVLLSAPRGAVLAGLSAASHDGLVGFPSHVLDLVVAASNRTTASRTDTFPVGWRVRIRRTRHLSAIDVRRDQPPPRTRLPRSIVDAASDNVPVRRARVLVIAAVQQRLTTPAALTDALSRRGRCKNRGVIAESIVDAMGGVESLPERDFDLIRRRARLPPPVRQQVLRRPDGLYYLDDDWPEWGIRAEIHGIPHSSARQWDQDLLRQNDITIAGGGLLVFSSFAIRHQPDVVAEQLIRMFRSRGWTA